MAKEGSKKLGVLPKAMKEAMVDQKSSVSMLPSHVNKEMFKVLKIGVQVTAVTRKLCILLIQPSK